MASIFVLVASIFVLVASVFVVMTAIAVVMGASVAVATRCQCERQARGEPDARALDAGSTPA